MERKRKAVDILTAVTDLGIAVSAALCAATRFKLPWLCLGVTAAVLAAGVAGALINSSLPREERMHPTTFRLFAVTSPWSSVADILAILLLEVSFTFSACQWLALPSLVLLAVGLAWSVGYPIVKARRKKH